MSDNAQETILAAIALTFICLFVLSSCTECSVKVHIISSTPAPQSK